MSAAQLAVCPDATADVIAAIEELDPPRFALRVYPAAGAVEELIERLQGHAVVISDGTRIDAAVLAQCSDLRAIVFLGTGVDFYIDRPACERSGILLEGIRGYGDRTVAEHAFALMLAVYRDLGSQQELMRGGGWGGMPIGELGGKTLGVVGLGGVGTELARLASGFGMKVIGWSRSGTGDGACDQVELQQLLAQSDVVSLHLAAVPGTANFIDARKIDAMKPGAVLINTARASLVDERALLKALASGHLAGAGLDVYEREPPASDAAIRAAPNVVLSCHSAWRSPEATRELVRRAYARVDDLVAEWRIQ